jgi:hypothetical protein
MVTDPGQAARRLEDDGWVLDAGQAHRGKGTRNRRLAWPEQFFELLWVTDAAEARSNPLRLDRRADWTSTGASPFGLAFRGRLDPAYGTSSGSTTRWGRASGFIATTSGSRNGLWSSCSKPPKGRWSGAGHGSGCPRPSRIAVPASCVKCAFADRPHRSSRRSRDPRSSTGRAHTCSSWSWATKAPPGRSATPWSSARRAPHPASPALIAQTGERRRSTPRPTLGADSAD